MPEITLPPSWKTQLSYELERDSSQSLFREVKKEYDTHIVYPPFEQVFRAFDLCPFDAVKVVIIGQDPYHGPKQANGLCFAVGKGVRIPPSLRNIFKEMKGDLGINPYDSGDLSRWARQGVLLLNAVLTVRAGFPASHKGKGWEQFTSAIIETLNAKKEGIVYILWGKYAQEKGLVIDRSKNLVLTSAHPSPFSATKFFGNHHFSKCNKYLVSKGREPIDWR